MKKKTTAKSAKGSNKIVVATWNIENWAHPIDVEKEPDLATRIMFTRPMLRRLGADILCLQEVHAPQGDISAFDELLKGTPYAEYNRVQTHKDGNPDMPMPMRNLVILTRFKVLKVEQIHNQLTEPMLYKMVTADPAQDEPKPVKWERPILYAQLELPNGRTLHMINIHLKSKLPANIPGQMLNRYTWKSNIACAEGQVYSSLQRVGQAFEVRQLIETIFAKDADAWICVVGDYNADSDEVPSNVIRGPVSDTGNADLVPFQLIPCENSVPADRRFSHIHHGKGNMLDHVMASSGLHACHTQTFIHNETLEDESAAFANNKKFPRPDHAGVRVEFNLDHACVEDCCLPPSAQVKTGTRKPKTGARKPAAKATGAKAKKPVAKTARKRTTAKA